MRFKRMVWCGVLMAAAAVTAQDEPLARMTLQSGKKWVVYLQGRKGDVLEMRRKGDQNAIQMPASAFSEMEFRIEVDLEEARDWYRKGEFDRIRQEVGGLIEERLPYLDIPNNLTPYSILMLKANYWDGHYDEVVESAERLSESLDDDVRRTAEGFRALTHLEREETNDARRIIEKLDIREDAEGQGAMDWYLLSLYRQQRGELISSQETVAHVVAFHPRDFEWMPAALHHSAELYGLSDDFNAADRVIAEVRTFFGHTFWSNRVDSLQTRLRELEREAMKSE
ncbi:hypothetical protein [Kiritimatiella glycovorans]|uniref:Uncharacterized protein n=1 Tax=Kiritimatiella glycovorans TaxID=1307763 RepID=A0A0G3ECR7_9BACT|nr:hypothetical protein [Kiritimatiella glycovorans]AKJ64098.1 hypothetical protein L21SP4_00835 [Kiritimatiella glycovorans]